MLKGIDVSFWQQTTPSLTGLSFLFARASIGTNIDSMYDTHIAAARKAGLVTGAYHFGTSADVQKQVDTFLASAHDADLIVLDLDVPSTMTYAQAATFISIVQDTGRSIGLYSSEYGYPNFTQDWNWVANYSRQPVVPFDFWQYRGSPLDLDYFNGDLATLQSLGANMSTVVTLTTVFATPRPFTLASGQVLNYYSASTPGKVIKTSKGPYTGTFDAIANIIQSPNASVVPHGGPFLRSGGLYIVAGFVTCDMTPEATPSKTHNVTLALDGITIINKDF